MRIKSTLLFVALAVMLVCGVTVSTGHVDNFSEIERLANQGDADAQVSLGEMYDEGKGVEQDHAKAAYWYEKAADQGNMHAQLYLGMAYYHGTGVPQDKQKGCTLFKAAAEQGHRAAHEGYYQLCE